MSHLQLCSDGLPAPLFILPAEPFQRVNLLLTPATFVDGWVEEVLPEAAQVVCIPGSFKLSEQEEEKEGTWKKKLL